MQGTGTQKRSARGFSLLELVIVVVILAVIASIAIPRMSRGSEGAGSSALAGDLAVLRTAIDLYAAEHGGAFPDKPDAFERQLLEYTNAQGEVESAMDATHTYGPYLCRAPPLPVGIRKGCVKIREAPADDVGWVYNKLTGEIRANTTTEKDAAGTLYSDY